MRLQISSEDQTQEKKTWPWGHQVHSDHKKRVTLGCQGQQAGCKETEYCSSSQSGLVERYNQWIPDYSTLAKWKSKKRAGIQLLSNINEVLGQSQYHKERRKKSVREGSLILARTMASWGEGIILSTGEQKNCSCYSIVSTTELKLV